MCHLLTKKEKLQKTLKRFRFFFFGNRGDARAAFVFGDMRSGTNMLIQTLNNCIDTECYYENDDEAFDNYRLREREIIAGLIQASRADLVVFKPIADSQHASKILASYDGSKAIWIYRHYSDAVISALKNWKEHNRYLYYMLFDPQVARWRLEEVLPEHLSLVRKYYEKGVSEASARALIWYLRTSLYFQQNLDKDVRVFLVNYEHLVSNPSIEFKKITEFLGCQFSNDIVKKVFSSSVNKEDNLVIDQEIKSLCDELFFKMTDTCQKSTLIVE